MNNTVASNDEANDDGTRWLNLVDGLLFSKTNVSLAHHIDRAMIQQTK